jgi:hypothetical protein
VKSKTRRCTLPGSSIPISLRLQDLRVIHDFSANHGQERFSFRQIGGRNGEDIGGTIAAQHGEKTGAPLFRDASARTLDILGPPTLAAPPGATVLPAMRTMLCRRKNSRMIYLSRTIFLSLVMAACFAATATAVPPPGPQVDPCKQFDTAAVSAAIKAWFGPSVALSVYPVPGRGSGTCCFSAETPRHLDITIFYAPVANVAMYGFHQPTPAGNTPVAGLGDAALFQEQSNPADRYKSENISILKGRAVLVFDLTVDKNVAFVPQEKLAEFAAKEFVPKM